MDLLKAMENRHAVRAYTAKPIGAETAQALRGCIERCNAEGGLHMNLVLNEPTASAASWRITASSPSSATT